jgi:hypothetical protein
MSDIKHKPAQWLNGLWDLNHVEQQNSQTVCRIYNDQME